MAQTNNFSQIFCRKFKRKSNEEMEDERKEYFKKPVRIPVV
jgi:hypothetical protein